MSMSNETLNTQKEIANILMKADEFKKDYSSAREQIFKSLSENGIMIFFHVLMCEGELSNTPETIMYSNGAAEFRDYKEYLAKAMRSLGKFGTYSKQLHNKLKAATQKARAFLGKYGTTFPTGIFLRNSMVDEWRAVLLGTEDEEVLKSLVKYKEDSKKGPGKYLKYKARYRKGVKKYYRELAYEYVFNNFNEETEIAKKDLYNSLERSYKIYSHKGDQELNAEEVALIWSEVEKGFSRHPLIDLTNEAKYARFDIIYNEYPVPSLNFMPTTEVQIDQAKAADIKKAQEQLDTIKEMMITETIATFYTQMKEILDKLNSKMSKGSKVDKDSEDYLQSLLGVFKDMKFTLGSNNQLDEMEAALTAVSVPAAPESNPKTFKNFFTNETAKKVIDAGGLKTAVEHYAAEVNVIAEAASILDFASTMKALKF
jgi:hypothetical protein